VPHLRNVFCRLCNSPWVRSLMITITAALGSLLFIPLLGSATFNVSEFTFKVYAVPSLGGKTVLELQPFGTLSARTHQGMMQLHIQLERIGPGVTQLSGKDDQDQLIQELKNRIPRLLVNFSLRQILAGALGSLLLVLLVFRPRPKIILGAGLGGALLVGIFLGIGISTYQVDSFKEPEYDGIIAMAPNLISMTNDSLKKLQQIQTQTERAVNNIQSLSIISDSISALGDPNEQGSVQKILLVSDLHSNPVGVEFISSIVHNFGINFIIDAGDLTDFGTPLEAQTALNIKKLGVPYVFCPGNHDTPEISLFMQKLGNVTVLQKHTVSVGGLKILGSPDPLSASHEVEVKNHTIWNNMVNDNAEALQDVIKKEGSPDILVIHNPVISQKMAGTAPIIVSGHTHKQKQETLSDGKTILLNPGTVGAAGLRGLYSGKNVPYSAIILYYQAGSGPLAADFIVYDPFSKRFSLERQLLQKNPEEEKALSVTASVQPEVQKNARD